MVAWHKKKTGDILLLLNGIVLAVVLNQLASLFFFRVDLTEEKRYSIKAPTVQLLETLDDDVFVDVYLDGDLNAEFRRLRKAVRETLEEFRIYSGNKLHYRFADPLAATGERARQEFMGDLVAKGLKPLNIIDTRDGRRTEKIVFPGAVLSYGGLQTGVMLLKDQVGGAQQDINRAIEGLEYELATAILQITVTERKRVGFVSGHGELDSIQLAGMLEALQPLYDVNLRASLSAAVTPADYEVLIVAKPLSRFSEPEKYHLDQFVMNGGKLVMFLDAVRVDLDSVARGDYFAFPYDLGLDDLLFKYGVRLNPDLVQDIVSLRYPVVTGQVNGNPQITPIEWPLFPLVNQYAQHPATRNLDATVLRFAGSVDSVKAAGIRKTPLLFTSRYSRTSGAPLKINVNDLRKEITPQNFSTPFIPVAYLLEGRFNSLFENRFVPEGVSEAGRRNTGEWTRVVVVADGDVMRGEVSRRTGEPIEPGFDPVTNHTFANKELVANLVAFLTDDDGLIMSRNREIRARPLDKERVRESRSFWQAVNFIFPLALIVTLGLVKLYLRRRHYVHVETPRPHGSPEK